MSRLLFAVTREDPNVEAALLQPSDSVLTITSGGCTPLSLQAKYPSLRVTAFDINNAQLEHVEEKMKAVSMGHLARLNVEYNAPNTLNQMGEFESLFRLLRHTFIEFVCPEQEINAYFSGKLSLEEQQQLVQQWMSSQYWLAPFHCSLNDPFLHLMFSEKATQHADNNSYSTYFAERIAQGLLRKDGPHNPFLQHIFLGYYKQRNAPSYIFAKRVLPIELVQGSLLDIADIASYQLVSLSNIFDWSEPKSVQQWTDHLAQLQSGAKVLIRQLNNTQDWLPFFSEYFIELPTSHLNESERSLFYNQHRIFQRK